jgi:hypothetical protein
MLHVARCDLLKYTKKHISKSPETIPLSYMAKHNCQGTKYRRYSINLIYQQL